MDGNKVPRPVRPADFLVVVTEFFYNMSQVFTGRFTAQTNEPFVVFLIGFRVNKFWSFSIEII
jgi:hypothetical protein